MINRARAVAAGTAALTTLALLMAGLPVLLYRFGGSPLPSQLPDWRQVTSALASADDGSLLLAVVRDCSWLAWLLFTCSVVAEVYAVASGRRAPRLHLGGVQGAAARLVALAALTFAAPTALSMSVASASAATPATTPATTATTATPAHGVHSYLGAPHADGMAAPRELVTVHPGDCLWLLAERYLGAGDRYPEIASLNYGRAMGDGEVFTNPALIRPGWQLIVPADAYIADAPPPSSAQHAGHNTADQHYQRRHAAAGSQPAGTQPAPSTSGNGLPRPTAEASPPATSAGDHLSASAALGTGIFVTGALAGSVLTSLARLRFRQRQQRRRGRRIALPGSALVRLAEKRLRAAARADPAGAHAADAADAAEPLRTLQDALACLESSLLASGQELPDIVGLHVTPDRLEVLLSAPAPHAPPPPFEISPGRQGMCWQLPLPAAGPRPPGGTLLSGLLPGLVTAGATAEGYLLLDLESLQVTGCDGPPELVSEVVTTVATELASGQWSGWYDLLLVGCDELEPLGRAEHCASLDDALALLESRHATVGQRLADRVPADVRQLRLAEPDNEDWGLTVLVSRVVPSSEQMTWLLRIADDSPGGIAALIAGDPEAAGGRMAPVVLQLAPDELEPGGIVANVVPLQLTVRPRALSAEDYAAVAEMFAAAAVLDDVGQDAEPYPFYGAPPWLPEASDQPPDLDVIDVPWPPDEAEPVDASAPSHAPVPSTTTGRHARPEQPPQRLEVRILGPFAVTGADEQLQPKQAELMLALALAAPAGLSKSALCAMLGSDPDHPKPTDAVRQIITRTRHRIGLAADGQEYIIHTGKGQYYLHPDVALDWSQFCALTASGRVEDLRAALALVRGQPFTGSYFWWVDVPLVETVRAAVVDAAEMLAELELAAGNPRASARAARAGLMAEASAEQLWRALMRAEHAAGNLAGVAEAWRLCLDTIEDVAPGGEPHPDTVAAYRQLTLRTRERTEAR